jgi:transcriptional regulator with XRE-family HTH domain
VSLGKKTGTSQPTMNRLMSARDDTQDPRLGTIEATAEALKMPAWALLFDSPSLEELADQRITESIKLMLGCSKKNRDKIFDLINDIARLDSLDRNHS